jgi:hypothetical protein
VKFPVFGTAGEDAILGSVNEGEVQMETEKVELEISYEAWVASHFTDGEPSGPDRDFDEDGRSNFLEYTLGSDPKMKDGPFQMVFGRDFTIEFSRASERSVRWVLEGSDDLRDFAPLEGGFEVEVDRPTRLGYRITDTSSEKKFFRVKAEPEV